MATKNAINSSFPVPVSDGGTGAITLTDHGVLVGAGTSAIAAIAVGGTGQLLTGIDASNPAFSSSLDGDFGFTSTTAGATRKLAVIHQNNVSSSSHAVLEISVGGSSAGDPIINYQIDSGQTFSSGIDNSDSDKFKISASSVLETTTLFSATTAGEITMPLQPAFGAVSALQSSATGDGTVYTVTFGSSEYFDQNADFDGTSTFTAPISGRYIFNCQLVLDGLTSSHTTGTITLSTSNRDYVTGYINIGAVKSSGDNGNLGFGLLVDMDASDTAVVKTTVSNGTKVVDVTASSWFNGFLAC